jgi:uncharacterized protein with NAD-binding domain and iron-sulfur cluster
MNKHVLIIGGGVAGMSAAHELIERGFKVTVLEKQKMLPGGKARSIPVPGSADDGKKELPGEHGFRFFPGFYRHIIHTMDRIPYPDIHSTSLASAQIHKGTERNAENPSGHRNRADKG